MKLREKIMILAVAVAVTFVGFNLMVPRSSLDLLRIGRTQGYEIVVIGTPDGGTTARHAIQIVG